MQKFFKVVVYVFATIGLLYVVANVYFNAIDEGSPGVVINDATKPDKGCTSKEHSSAHSEPGFKVSHVEMKCGSNSASHKLVISWREDGRLVQQVEQDIHVYGGDDSMIRSEIKITDKNKIHIRHSESLIVPEGSFDDYSVTSSVL